jgi:hypothetical protein
MGVNLKNKSYKRLLLATSFMLVSYLFYFSTLKMRRRVLTRRLSISKGLQDVTLQKTELFNLTSLSHLLLGLQSDIFPSK